MAFRIVWAADVDADVEGTFEVAEVYLEFEAAI
jgi:hypothetical protein